MGRRRLTTIAAAFGMLVGLGSSGIAAQAAAAPGPDATYLALVATYQPSTRNTCYGNNGAVVVQSPDGSTCSVKQVNNGRNIAVCVQANGGPAPTQTCSITQTTPTNTSNNYALIVQRVTQDEGTTQTASQRAQIHQSNGSGSNFGGVFQIVGQSIGSEADPSQTSTQHVEDAPFVGPGFTQSADAGSNYAAVAQWSSQSMNGGTQQTQTADQFAGHSGQFPGDGVDQTTRTGGNAAALIQKQKQEHRSDIPATQTQTATEDADLTQNGSPGQNLASGNQFQDQREDGPSGSTQHQTGDPRCCSTQTGGRFFINEVTNQLATLDGQPNPAAVQTEQLIANCDSPPPTGSTTGGCFVMLSATVQGQTTTGPFPPCQGTASCHRGIACVKTACFPCVVFEGSFCSPIGGGRIAQAAFRTRDLALAPGRAAGVTGATRLGSAPVRSAPHLALLT